MDFIIIVAGDAARRSVPPSAAETSIPNARMPCPSRHRRRPLTVVAGADYKLCFVMSLPSKSMLSCMSGTWFQEYLRTLPGVRHHVHGFNLAKMFHRSIWPKPFTFRLPSRSQANAIAVAIWLQHGSVPPSFHGNQAAMLFTSDLAFADRLRPSRTPHSRCTGRVADGQRPGGDRE